MPRIDDQSKSVELPQLNQPKKPQLPTSDRLSQTQADAHQAAEQTKVALVTNHQERLVKLNEALDKAEQRRGEVLERLSTRMVYLQDDDLFMHDLLTLTQRKLKGNQQQQPERQEVTATAIDALVDAFDVIGDWELPSINPATAAGGALPAAY